MGEAIYPRAVQVAGAHRGYRAGRIILTTAIRHYTVGANSLATCGRDFQLLQARDGTLYQGCELDARCWGAGDPWNGRSLHVEAEWHPVLNADEPVLNDAMIDSLAPFAEWLEHDSGWAIRRDASYEGPDRVGAWDGWIDHRWLIQTGDWHYNLWPSDQWQRIVTGRQPAEEASVKPGLFAPDGLKVWLYNPATHTKTWVRTMAALKLLQALLAIGGANPQVVTDPQWAPLIAAAREITDPTPISGGPGVCRFEPAPTTFKAV